MASSSNPKRNKSKCVKSLTSQTTRICKSGREKIIEK